MLRWSLGVTRLDRVPNETIRLVMGVAPIQEKIRERRLRWYGHVKRSPGESVAFELLVNGKRGRGLPKLRWLEDNIRKDMLRIGLTEEDALNRAGWRRETRVADTPPVGRI